MPVPTHRGKAALAAALAMIASPLTLSTPALAEGALEPLARFDIDTAIVGASFSTVDELFPGEQTILTSGFGALEGGLPVGGGTLQAYRPGDHVSEWTKFTIFGRSADIVFPNRTTVSDVNQDGLNDVIVPSGYFFDTAAAVPLHRGAITWWENKGLDPKGAPRPFVRHDIVTGQAGSYHGVEHVDLDGDGIRDIVTTSEDGRVSHDRADDTVTLQFFKGRADHSFDAAVALAQGSGGSHPVVHDIDGDGRLDIASSQYFANPTATFMWFQQVGDASAGLTSANFTKHTIADRAVAGDGFQIVAVPDFREKGTVSWIGVNHQNRCFLSFLPKEMVMEFVPGDDFTAPWQMKELSVPATPSATPTTCDPDFAAGRVPIHPSDEITSRANPGQGAPGVLGHGDVDNDGDIDLVVAGDGDRRLFWIEQKSDRSTVLHTLTAPGEVFGQAGGSVAQDLDGDGLVELVFSSFDENTLALWSRTPRKPSIPHAPEKPVVKTTSRLKATPALTRVAKGRKASWTVRLTAAKGGPKRSVVVKFRPAKGKASTVRTIKLRPRGKGKHRATFTWRPQRSGKLTFVYRGVKVSPTVKDTRASRTVRIRVRR